MRVAKPLFTPSSARGWLCAVSHARQRDSTGSSACATEAHMESQTRSHLYFRFGNLVKMRMIPLGHLIRIRRPSITRRLIREVSDNCERNAAGMYDALRRPMEMRAPSPRSSETLEDSNGKLPLSRAYRGLKLECPARPKDLQKVRSMVRLRKDPRASSARGAPPSCAVFPAFSFLSDVFET